MIAIALKRFSSELDNRAITQKLNGIQKTLVTFAGAQLAANYGDDDCVERHGRGNSSFLYWDPTRSHGFVRRRDAESPAASA